MNPLLLLALGTGSLAAGSWLTTDAAKNQSTLEALAGTVFEVGGVASVAAAVLVFTGAATGGSRRRRLAR